MKSRCPLRALALVCSLNRSPTESSSQLIAEQVLLAMKDPRVIGDLVRVVDHEIKPCASVDMGSGDEWPAIRERIIEADILIVASPTWMGQPSNVCQRVLERLDAELSEPDDEGRLLTYGKGCRCCHCRERGRGPSPQRGGVQVLKDVGYSIPAGGVTYWNGEAMHRTDYKDLDKTPESVASITAT